MSKSRARKSACLAALAAWCAVVRAADAPFLFRLDENLSSAVEINAQPVESAPHELMFGFSDPASAPWTAQQPDTRVAYADGNLVAEVRQADTLSSPSGLNFDAKKVGLMQIRMKVDGTGEVRLEWRPLGKDWEPNWHYMFRLFVQKPGEWATYEVDTASLQAWRNEIIDQFRLQVPQPARVEVDFIRFQSRFAQFAKAGAARVLYSDGKETRSCIGLIAPGHVTFEIAVPENARFTAGLAALEKTPPVSAALTLAYDGEEKALMTHEELAVENWTDQSVDLSEYAGRTVRLAIEANCAGGHNYVFWSNPSIYQPWTDRPSARPGRPMVGKGPDKNFVVYVIDTLRADRLGLYGHERETAPVLRRLAGDGAVFQWCFSQDVWTKPSMVTLHVGVDRLVHGIRQYGHVVPDGLLQFPVLLRQAGYVTGAITQNAHTPPDTQSPQYAYSFVYTPNMRVPRGEPRLGSPELSEAALRDARTFLEKNAERRFFLYMHTIEPHDPYSPPKEFRGKFSGASGTPNDIDLYDEEILWADANLEKFVNLLKEFNVYDDTVLIITADHGEAFREHENMVRHNGKPYNELIRIPLVVAYPMGLSGGRVIEENVAMIDIGPTILDWAGIEIPDQFQGVSLLPLLNGESPEVFQERTVYAYEGFGAVMAAIQGAYKYLHEPAIENSKMFEVRNDPGEMVNLLAVRDVMAAYVAERTKIGEALRKAAGEGPVALDQEEIEQLRGLGYL